MKWSEEKIEQALKEAKATLAIEGMELTHKEEDLLRANFRGDLSDEEYFREALELAKKG